jgi:CMP-N-acetylneuraminic acid synthetase
MRILAVIPARGGSKGVPRKNVAIVAGKPLIAYSIAEALKVERFTDLIVSTNDEEIASIARGCGAEVPFMRPAELAGDRTPSLPVMQHAVEQMEGLRGTTYDIVVMLQPTTPLRTAVDIDAALDLMAATGCDSVVSLVDVGGNHPFRMKRLIGDRVVNYVEQDGEDMRPRQELPTVYIRSGSVYASRRAVVMEDETLVGADCRGYVIEPERAINIDTMNDLRVAEILIVRGNDAAGTEQTP